MVLRAFLDRKRRFDGAPSFNGRSALLVFALIGVGSALVLPVVFAGVPVYSPSLGLEEGFALRPPLSLSQSNFAQAAYLLLQVLVVWAAAALSPFSRSTRNFYVFTFYLLVSVIFLQLSCRGLGLQFPYKMLQNNPGYYMEDISTDLRPPGTFPEPSMAGLALTMFLVGFLSESSPEGKPLARASSSCRGQDGFIKSFGHRNCDCRRSDVRRFGQERYRIFPPPSSAVKDFVHCDCRCRSGSLSP